MTVREVIDQLKTMLVRRLILFLVRRRLGLKKYETFRFAEQKSNAVYAFASDGLMKSWRGRIEKSRVSLNWLLDDECQIKRCDYP